MTMDEENWKRLLAERADLLRMISQLSDIAARSAKEISDLTEKATTAERSGAYWIGEYNRVNGKLNEAQRRIKELESPLAELAREAKE
jgi:hypothetical protein